MVEESASVSPTQPEASEVVPQTPSPLDPQTEAGVASPEAAATEAAHTDGGEAAEVVATPETTEVEQKRALSRKAPPIHFSFSIPLYAF